MDNLIEVNFPITRHQCEIRIALIKLPYRSTHFNDVERRIKYDF